MRVWGAVAAVIITSVPITSLMAQVADEAATTQGSQDENISPYPLEIVIRPRQTPSADGYYENGRVNTIYGQELRLSGYHMSGSHRRMIDGKVVYDVWQSESNLLTHNILKEAGLLSLPSFEERLAHELVYGSSIGEQMGGIYKNMSFLEIAHSFNLDPTPAPIGFGGKGIYGSVKFNTGYSHDQMTFGVIDFSSVGDR